MVLAVVIFLYLVVAFFDYIPLIKKKEKKEFVVYTTFLIISFILLFLITIDIVLPSPTNLIKYLLDPIIK